MVEEGTVKPRERRRGDSMKREKREKGMVLLKEIAIIFHKTKLTLFK